MKNFKFIIKYILPALVFLSAIGVGFGNMYKTPLDSVEKRVTQIEKKLHGNDEWKDNVDKKFDRLQKTSDDIINILITGKHK